MATTGGTNLRDDIMRLDETGKKCCSLVTVRGVVFFVRKDFVHTVPSMTCPVKQHGFSCEPAFLLHIFTWNEVREF